MAQLPAILGTKNVLANIAKSQLRLGVVSGQALKLAGLRLQRESQQLVPVDTGNLKASAYTRSAGVGFKTVVTVGYEAAYALFVHEAVGMVLKGQPRPGGTVKSGKRKGQPKRGKYWDPQDRAQAKFLEQPARTLRKELLAIIRAHIKLSGL